MTSEPSRYVQPEVSEARVDRLWSQLSERLEQRPSFSIARGWLLAGAISASAAAGAWLYVSSGPASSPGAQAVPGGAKLETQSDPLSVTLVDGSKVQLAPRTELSVRESQPTSVALTLV